MGPGPVGSPRGLGPLKSDQNGIEMDLILKQDDPVLRVKIRPKWD